MYKRFWLLYGKTAVENKEYHSIKWVSKAADHLALIQQKKLFDMQCLWRAEKMTIPGVEICYDFNMWEKDILNCPFLEPVSRDDIDLYADYLVSETGIDNDYTHFSWGTDEWQDYDGIKKAYNSDDDDDERDVPEWYEFYNERRGTGVYMTLPDIRGDKEKFYMDLAREAHKSKTPVTTPAQPAAPPNYLWYTDKEKREFFIKTFESKDVFELYEAYEWAERNRGLKEDLESSLYLLYEADEPVAMEPDKDWVNAIKRTANKYRNQKIAEALPLAWEQYMMNVQMNIAFNNEKKFHAAYDTLRKMYAEGIIEGRKFNGEPADYNF
jgi:hypothetical protein